MSVTTVGLEQPPARPVDQLTKWARDNNWMLGLLLFLGILLVFTKIINPTYGVTGVQGLANSVLPLALAAVAQTVVVISGGIDLSIASVMALTSCIAAKLMQDQSPEYGVAVVIGVLLLGLVIGAINGALVVVTRVPDIIVTLGTRVDLQRRDAALHLLLLVARVDQPPIGQPGDHRERDVLADRALHQQGLGAVSRDVDEPGPDRIGGVVE